MVRNTDDQGWPGAGTPSTKRVSPYVLLKNKIHRGELEPGQPLIESTLATWCRVSRTPIREALRQLQQDGLVERNGAGLVVRERSPDEILDIYDIRIVLEGMAGRLAAERRTSHDLRALQLWVDRSKQVSPTDTEGRIHCNQQFHRVLWHAARNESLTDLLERLNLHLVRYPGTTLAFPGRWEDALLEHTSLLRAIELRDPAAAHEVALAHFVKARDIRLKLFQTEADPALKSS